MQKKRVCINGMHCAACEVLIERKWKKIPGIEKVRIDQVSGNATIHYTKEPSLEDLETPIKQDGYSVSEQGAVVSRTSMRDYAEVGGAILIVVSVYFILKQFDLIPKGLSISSTLSYPVIFVIGLVAAVSTCMAVSGGLLIAISAKYAQANPGLSTAQKFRPHIFFNIGRIISYTAFGAVLGLLGSFVRISPFASGIMVIVASVVMILLGFQMLNVFPSLRRFQPKMPRIFTNSIQGLSSTNNRAAPLLLGASTFFLPCGFTQALQLYALTTGSALTGALTMLVFSLGTLPALLAVGAISSFVQGTFRRYFFRFAGAAVLLIGIVSVTNGLVLTGVSLPSFKAPIQGSVAQVIDGTQHVSMNVVDLEYRPSRFIVQKGIPVAWTIDASQAQGCAQVITVPKLGITEFLPTQGTKTITFTPTQTGTIGFSCTMGMTTRGAAFRVVEVNESV